MSNDSLLYTCQTTSLRRSRRCGRARTRRSRSGARPCTGWSWRPRPASGTGRPWWTARRGRRSATGCWPSGSRGWRPGWPRGGFGPGDVLALWAPNLPQWAGVALGAMAAGGTVTGASPACTERELAAQLADAGASVLVTVPSLVPAARSVAAAAGVREVVVLGEAEGATPILDLLAAGAAPRPGPALDPAAAVGPAPLLERHHRAAQGGAADPRQPGHLGPPGRPRAARRRPATPCSRCRRSPTSWGSWSPWPCRCARARPWSPCPASSRDGSWSCSSGTGSPSWSGPRRCCGCWPPTRWPPAPTCARWSWWCAAGRR